MSQKRNVEIFMSKIINILYKGEIRNEVIETFQKGNSATQLC